MLAASKIIIQRQQQLQQQDAPVAALGVAAATAAAAEAAAAAAAAEQGAGTSGAVAVVVGRAPVAAPGLKMLRRVDRMLLLSAQHHSSLVTGCAAAGIELTVRSMDKAFVYECEVVVLVVAVVVSWGGGHRFAKELRQLGKHVMHPR